MTKYDEYVAEHEAAGTTPLDRGDWQKMRMAEGREAKSREAAKAEAKQEEARNLDAEIRELRERIAAMEGQAKLDPGTVIPTTRPEPDPEPWGANGVYSYQSDTKELELTMQAGYNYEKGGRQYFQPHRAIRFSNNFFSTKDEEERDWLEQQPEYTGEGGSKYPARVWRTSVLRKGQHVVQEVRDGPSTTQRAPQRQRYESRPSPLQTPIH